MTTKELQRQIEAVMTVQQDLDHEMVQLGRDMDDLKEQFKSLALDAVTHAEQDKVNSEHLELIDHAINRAVEAYTLARADKLVRDFYFKNFDRIFARLSRLAVVVIIAIIIGVMGCIL